MLICKIIVVFILFNQTACWHILYYWIKLKTILILPVCFSSYVLIRNLSQFHIPSFFLVHLSPSLVFSHLSLFTQKQTELMVFMWSSKELFLISTLLKFHLRIIILRPLPWYEKWLQFYLDKKTLTLAQPGTCLHKRYVHDLPRGALGSAMERMKPMNSVKATGSASCTHLGEGGATRQTDSHRYQILQIWEKHADLRGKYDAINVLIYLTDTAVLLQTSSCEKRQIPANGIQRITGHRNLF